MITNKYLEKIASLTKAAGVGIDIHGYDEKGSKIKTPHDGKTSYKLNMDVSMQDSGLPLHQYTTDNAYSTKEVTKDLSKEDLGKVISHYKKGHAEYMSYLKTGTKNEYSHSEKGLFGLGKPKAVYKKVPYSKEEIDSNQKWGDAFVAKAEHLSKHPKFKYARLEWE